ncbi:MAG TPA: hypothetical protein VLS48_08665 [Anaerolineales bacterium]|nr:hypothetical protein [Anaerolineales bacterium]
MSAIRLVIGFMLLVAGSELHWFFVGAVVFLLAGMFTMQTNLPLGALETWRTTISLTALAVLLALPFKRWTSAAACFLAGGFLGLVFPGFVGLPGNFFTWNVFLIGGVFGLALFLFSAILALLTLSNLIGALLIVLGMPTGPFHPLLLFGIFFFTGMSIQYLLLQWGEPTLNR